MHHGRGRFPSGRPSGAAQCIKRDTKRGRARRGEKRSFWGGSAEGARPRLVEGNIVQHPTALAVPRRAREIVDQRRASERIADPAAGRVPVE